MTKWTATIVPLAALIMSGCSAHRVEPGEPIFSDRDRNIVIKEVVNATASEGGDMPEAEAQAAYDPAGEARTDHMHRGEAPLDDPPAPPANAESAPVSEVATLEQVVSAPGTTKEEGSSWVLNFGSSTVIGVLNSTPCTTQVVVVGETGIWPVGVGGLLNIEVMGRTGDELLLMAVARCTRYEPGLGPSDWYEGASLKRICAPYKTNRATAWVLKKTEFSLDPQEPSPCQGPEPGETTYPYYPAGGWGDGGWYGGSRRSGISIQINNRRRGGW